MSPQEFEQALHDAEIKLARLKALYEQWFQGIERLEPSVPRKELDRTIDLLKKSVPRNTALRFRMQQLVARYGTYGIYWGRIARQIEEGTYKRDVIRVNKKKNPKNEKRAVDQAWELDVEVEEFDGLDDEKTDPGIVATTPQAASGPPKAISATPKSALAFDEGDLDAILGALSPAADESAAKSRSARPLSPFAMGARPAGGGASATFGKPKDKPAASAPPTASAPPVAAPIAAPAAPAAKPVVAPPTPARPMVAPPMPPPARPAMPAMTPAKPMVAPPMPAPVRAPAVTPAAAAPRPPAPTPAPAPRPPAAAAAASADLDERQMRAIYSRYVDARKQNNERADVRYEVLAESVKKMMPKLREKHAGKPIDFEVVLQNGKVGLKPKVGG